MEIRITKKSLAAALARTSSIADRKSSMQIISNVLIDAGDENRVRISAQLVNAEDGFHLRPFVYALEQEYGSVESNPAFWNSISANAYLRDLDGPIQLHHATTDEEVPLAFSEMLYTEMQEANQTVEFFTYEGDNHNISNNFTTAMGRTVEFFDRYLKTDL